LNYFRYWSKENGPLTVKESLSLSFKRILNFGTEIAHENTVLLSLHTSMKDLLNLLKGGTP
jgi:hypothetical protein